jgi:hypothetical protein
VRVGKLADPGAHDEVGVLLYLAGMGDAVLMDGDLGHDSCTCSKGLTGMSGMRLAAILYTKQKISCGFWKF